MAAAPVTERAITLLFQIVGLAVLAGGLALLAAALYRWYVREEVPRGLALLFGLSGVAVYLNTTTALGQVIGGNDAPMDQALFNIAAFAAGVVGAAIGRRIGDRLAQDVFVDGGLRTLDGDVGQLVTAVGRVITVELPDEIDDTVGYDPVPEQTKETLAGKRFLFPRRLTVEELRERLVTRLKTDYAVGHVDIELTSDGTVEYLALGSRAAGIGPTLPPATNAVAIRADPAFAASSGDLVQVWETEPMRRVLTAELRGVADETVTVAIDAGDTPKIDPTKQYRLVTLPVDDRPDREFASLLRAADETFSSVTVEAGSPLHGLPIAALDLAVIAVKPSSEQTVTLPPPTTVLEPGDQLYVIARPEGLRRLETAAVALDPSFAARPDGETDPGAESGADAADADEPGASSTAASDDIGERADAETFAQLSEEFESGDADWDDSPAVSSAADPDLDEPTGEAGERPDETDESKGAASSDSLSDFDFGTETPDDEFELDVTPEAGDGGEQPAQGPGSKPDDGETPSEDDTDETGSESDDADEDDTNDTDGDEGGSTASFQQLKEEFESGDADWEDDVSDSPGGDMRLDE